MSLPPFEDLDAYASENKDKEGGDLPQRFYMTPEQEQLTDWKLKVNDVILPVHSQLLCVACKVYCGMATITGGGIVQDGPIPLEGCSLAHALAFLRVLYRVDCLASKPVAFLLKSGYLPGVLRLAHSLDWSMLKLLSGYASKAVESRVRADEYDIIAVADAASDLNLSSLRTACYSAVYALCKDTSSDFTEISYSSAIEIVDRLGESPELLKAALLVSLARKPISGKAIQRLLDRTIELPPALFTWHCPRESVFLTQRLLSDWFTWNDEEFRLYAHRGNSQDPSKCGVYLEQKNPPPEEGPNIEFTLRLVNWLKPNASAEKKGTSIFRPHRSAFGFNNILDKNVLPLVTDPDGFIILQVGHMRVVEEQQNGGNGA